MSSPDEHNPSLHRADGHIKALCEAQQKAKFYADAFDQAQRRRQAESRARLEAEQRAKAEADRRAGLEAELRERLRACAEQISRIRAAVEAESEARTTGEKAAKTQTSLMEALGEPVRTAVCECCGKQDIQARQLVRIDSGQLLCPDCLREFRRSCLP